ncbi:hypothetical protein TWF730_008159 [Orbilia blumenaviensis]|uniref:Uncharacterized protein n=1 Tax=Orbilia blumenaviensis TaxID=1796055 RepID=A0AAV9V2D4_9PEZI
MANDEKGVVFFISPQRLSVLSVCPCIQFLFSCPCHMYNVCAHDTSHPYVGVGQGGGGENVNWATNKKIQFPEISPRKEEEKDFSFLYFTDSALLSVTLGFDPEKKVN